MIMRPFLGKRIAIARRNLALCFPEWTPQQRDDVLAENSRMAGTMIIDMAISWWGSEQDLRKRVKFEGLAHIEKPCSKAKVLSYSLAISPAWRWAGG